MSKWIPTPAYADRMPVDISFVFEREKPAGKHGFLRREGNRFVFEDGTRGKFWGVCLAGASNFPTHDLAEQTASRLAQAGCNCVRMHWMDAEFDSPNIFAFTRGPRLENTSTLDPRSLERMDYLMYALKEQGIYIYLDNLTARRFKPGDGCKDSDKLFLCAKPYCIFDPVLRQRQKEYMTSLWTHVNPYTGLAPKDDPAVIVTDIVNEADLFGKFNLKKNGLCQAYLDEFRELFREWLEKNGKTYDWETCDLDANDPVMLEFKHDLTVDYFAEMRAHLRSIGVRIPVTGTTWGRHCPMLLKSHQGMDFTDAHHYYYDWRWTEEQQVCSSEQINGYPYVMPALGEMRDPTHPYFISEWDMPWPNDYRAESPIYYAAVGALQDWDGMALFGYSHSDRYDRMTALGREYSTNSIHIWPFEAGTLSAWNDPAKFGLFYHAALMFRRGDVAPAPHCTGVRVTNMAKTTQKTYETGLELTRLATCLTAEDETHCDRVLPDTDPVEREDPNVLSSEGGQLVRYLKQKLGLVNTPRTRIFYGTLATTNFNGVKYQKLCSMEGFSVKCENDFGVIALSSLTDDPVEQSPYLLLSAIGRARNTDMTGLGDQLMDIGHGPILSQALEAEITIRTERRDLHVHGINPEGQYVGEPEIVYGDGSMTFRIGDRFPAIYYLIVAE